MANWELTFGQCWGQMTANRKSPNFAVTIERRDRGLESSGLYKHIAQ